MIVIIVLLCRNPYFLLFDLWFRLSITAIVWIIVAGKFCDTLYYDSSIGWWRFRIIQYMVLGFCIRLSLLPFLLFQSWKVSIISIFVNYMVQCILPLTIYGLSMSLLLWWEWWSIIAHWVVISIDGIMACSDRALSHIITLSGNVWWKCSLSLFSYCILYCFYHFRSDHD